MPLQFQLEHSAVVVRKLFLFVDFLKTTINQEHSDCAGVSSISIIRFIKSRTEAGKISQIILYVFAQLFCPIYLTAKAISRSQQQQHHSH